jgi:hypothetical protein
MKDEKRRKSNRNQVEGLRCIGNMDRFIADGGKQRLFEPLWFRTYRYLELKVETRDEPLVVHDLYGQFTAYPFEQKASFRSNDPELDKIWEISWRTARLCAGETYFDCPYYEQLQYVGDTRIQALISLCVAGDDRLMRKAIEFLDHSRIPEGLTCSRYPSRQRQVIPPFSLYWVCMIHDYWMHREDPAFVRSFLPGIQSVLGWYESHLLDCGMLGELPQWSFVDWASFKRNKGGRPNVDAQGRSSILTLQYVYTLQRAADLAESMGQQSLAKQYRQIADRSAQAVMDLCWDSSRQLLADTPDKKYFSQHANVLGILTDAIAPDRQAGVMEKLLSQEDLVQCTVYFKFYLFQALDKVGFGDRYLDQLGIWHDMIKLGLTTWAEKPEPARSDCHAWGSHPMLGFLTTVCGIAPASPGFQSVKIQPHLGKLEFIDAVIPHPQGEIRVRFRKSPEGRLQGNVVLPQGIDGSIRWNNKTASLHEGSQDIDL